jgi:Lrp/AsnC family transcriptional regulator for asnA, asnC and gidA
VSTKNDEFPLDDIDRQIVRMLQKNGRMPNTEIGRALGLTETTIRKRVNRLLDEDYINIVAVPTPRVPATRLSALIGVSVRLGTLDAVAKKLAAAPEVRYLSLTTGRYDMIAEAFFPGTEQLLDFVSGRMAQVEGVVNVETSLVLRIEKFGYEWDLTGL